MTGAEPSERSNRTPDEDSTEASRHPPDEVVAEAKAAFDRKAQGDLAVLVHDSLIDLDDPAADHRLLFQHAHTFIELHVSMEGGVSNITGRVSPPGPVRAQLETDRAGSASPGGSSTASIDDGVFTFDEVRHGTVRILLPATGDEPAIHTDWFRI